jgi:hypothetical protein
MHPALLMLRKRQIRGSPLMTRQDFAQLDFKTANEIAVKFTLMAGFPEATRAIILEFRDLLIETGKPGVEVGF